MSGNERTGSKMDCLPFARDFYRRPKKDSNTKKTKKVSDLLCDSQRSAIASVGSAGSTTS